MLDLYKQLRTEGHPRISQAQPIFLDLIVRLLIVKSYALNMLLKPIKAANVLIQAEEVLKRVADGTLMIISNTEFPDIRPDTYHYPLEILQ